MKHVIICRTNGTIEDVTMTMKHDARWYAEQIGADLVEAVHPKGLKDPYFFLCDEEGLYKETPMINFIGSWMYGTQEHGQPIVGDIIIMKQVMTDEGPDIDGIGESEADVLAEWLLGKSREAYQAVMKKMGHRITPIK